MSILIANEEYYILAENGRDESWLKLGQKNSVSDWLGSFLYNIFVIHSVHFTIFYNNGLVCLIYNWNQDNIMYISFEIYKSGKVQNVTKSLLICSCDILFK